MPNSLQPPGLQPTKLLCPWGSPGKNIGVGCHSLLQGNLPNPGVTPRCPKLPADSLLSEPPGKPKNTGVDSLFLLQGIFLIQSPNQGLLHCRQIIYQLSYHGRSLVVKTFFCIIILIKKQPPFLVSISDHQVSQNM